MSRSGSRFRTCARAALAVLVTAAGGAAAARAPAPELSRSYDFENDALGAVPAGWFVPPVVARAGTTAEVTDERPGEGGRCVRLTKQGAAQFGNLMQAFDATPYRGRRVRYAALVRVAGDTPMSRAQLWLRVDREGGRTGFFDNMNDRPIRAPQWRRYEIVGDVGADARVVNVGLMMVGAGTAWLDAVTFEVLGPAGAGIEPPRPLTERGLANLTAYARLLGYVRHFHPGDEAAGADWDAVAVRGVRAVEDAPDPGALAERLETSFRPLAPGVEVAAQRIEPPAGDADPPSAAAGFVAWLHRGYGQEQRVGAARNVYFSRRQRTPLGEPAPPDAPQPGDAVGCDLGGGVWGRVPLCVYYDDQGTLPRPAPAAAGEPDEPAAALRPTGDDRATRLAAVILAWNVLQHFYPYFDVVETDWEEALADALRRAAEDPDAGAFAGTLKRLVARLHDGHGRVIGPGARGAPYRLPFSLAWVEGRLVVTHAPRAGAAGPARGDAVVAIDGRRVDALWNQLKRTISGATEQWKRHRALDELAARDTDAPCPVELLRPDGRRASIRVTPVPAGAAVDEPRPEPFAEIGPGVRYVDLARIDDTAFRRALPQLERAEGLVFDLRGYPSRLSTIVIAHLIDEPVTCAQWHVPVVRWPDRRSMTFHFSNWKVMPQAPRLSAPAAFVTDGRAISYAETYLGIVEHYGLAEIVGEPTAGTNGNVNTIALPGGYRVAFTGMKVLKHDGSRHHGVGILPTVPAKRTVRGVAAGRDELLEKAVEVVAAQAAARSGPE